jgi:hypothetical protein
MIDHDTWSPLSITILQKCEGGKVPGNCLALDEFDGRIIIV